MKENERFYGFTEFRGKPAGRGRDSRASTNQITAGPLHVSTATHRAEAPEGGPRREEDHSCSWSPRGAAAQRVTDNSATARQCD